jgi:DNA-binding SARP family transcriptional activator/TolB-like protein
LLELSLLGGFDARRGSDPIVLTARKAQALLAYLAMQRDQPVDRERLVALLWGGRDEKLAQNSLSQALTALRRSLGEEADAVLYTAPGHVLVHADAVSVDACMLPDLAASSSIVDLERAAALYRGPFLAGVTIREGEFEDWAEARRRQLESHALAALTRALSTYGERGDTAAMAATAPRVLELDPFHEPAHRALMHSYAEAGQTTLALRQYDTCAAVLATELGIRPDAATLLLRDTILTRRDGTVVVPAIGPDPASPIARQTAGAMTAGPTDKAPAHAAAAAAAASPMRSLGRGVWWKWAAPLAALTAVVLSVGVWSMRAPVDQGTSGDTGELTFERPTLAVLAFENLSADPTEEYFVNGIAEDLVTDLARNPSLFVISRHALTQNTAGSLDSSKAAELLGVRYVLRGSVQRSGERIRVNARLVDTRIDDHLWSERFEGGRTTCSPCRMQ